MATDSRVKYGYGMTGFSTYGAPISWTQSTTSQIERSRMWFQNFKGRKAALAQLLRDGFLPTSAYTDDLQEIVRSKVVSVSGQIYSDPNSTYDWYFVPMYNRVSVDPFDAQMEALVTAVQAKLQSKISGHGTNLVVTAVELPKTVGMVGDLARDLANAYRAVRRRNFSTAARLLGLAKVPGKVRGSRSFEDNWMEYRYGWRLVVYDVVSLLKTIHDLITERPPLLRVSALESSESLSRGSLPGKTVTMPNGKRPITFTENSETRITRTVRGGYIYELESVTLATGQAFGLINPFTWAWEVIPYSFVVDWFVNVGDVLEGLTAFQGKTYKDGWICREIQSSIDRWWTDVVKTSEVISANTSSIAFHSGPQLERRFRRSAAVFTPSSLRVSVDLNVGRVLDAIAMIVQRAKN